MKKIFWILVILVFVWVFRLVRQPLFFGEALVIEEGDTLYDIVESQAAGGLFGLKLYMKLNGLGTEFSSLSIGQYPDLIGKVSKHDFLSSLLDGPNQSFVSVRFLEGWSIYDYDRYLTKEGLIENGDYLNYVLDQSVISQLSDRFQFLTNFGNLSRLEGFLYPETYFVDAGQPLVEQLIVMQLSEFEKRVWDVYGNQLAGGNRFGKRGLDLPAYDIVSLASVVEKEERVLSQQRDVAGVLLNRLENNMRIDADITLCYGLEKGYEFCSPSTIVANLYDKTNVYNTRQLMGLPPTAIASPTADAVGSVLDATKHDFLFYLHDSSGRLHMSRDLSGHNDKKQRYL